MAVFPLTDKSPPQVGKPKLELVNNSKSWFRSIGIILILLISIGFFSRMLLSAMIVQRQTQIDELSESIAELDSDNRSLMFDIAQLESTKRIMRIALAEPGEEFETINGLGMVIPEITIYLDPLSNETLQGWQWRQISSQRQEP
tara:strand:+ start:1530 stop:1961 length:432 start_codon:yes stop_codon:yes gene_type:complete